jgi:hypothetical protein
MSMRADPKGCLGSDVGLRVKCVSLKLTMDFGTMSAIVTPLHPAVEVMAAAAQSLAKVHRYPDRCKLAANTVKAYRRQTTTYVAYARRGPFLAYSVLTPRRKASR